MKLQPTFELFFRSMLVTAVCISSVAGAFAQNDSLSNKKENSPSFNESVNAVKREPGNFRATALLKMSRKAEAIPVLEDAFHKITTKDAKEATASALVSLGAKNEEYRNYLQTEAKAVLSRNVPFPLPFDSSGHTKKGAHSKEFMTWANEHNMTVSEADEMALSSDPSTFFFLSAAEDRASIPLLLEGLNSSNVMIAHDAAEGLARLEYAPAIPKIILTCEQRPAEAASAIAKTLFLYHTAECDASAARFIKDPKVLSFIRSLSAQQRRKLLLGE